MHFKLLSLVANEKIEIKSKIPTFNTRMSERLGIKGATFERLISEAQLQRQKQFIKVINTTRNSEDSELADLDLEYTVFSHKIRTTVTMYIPHGTLDEQIIREIESIESSGLQWSREMGIYQDDKLKVLEATFCSALVHCAFPPLFKIQDQMAPGFSYDERKACDLWIRALFANDEDRDVFNLVEHPDDVKLDNTKILEACRMSAEEAAQRTDLSPKLKSMNVVTSLFRELLKGEIPEFFYLTLEQYLDSTVAEARHAFSLEWPSNTVLETVKGDSSGSVHAIALGALIKKINRDALLKNTLLRYTGDYTAKLVESHNDVNSHPKELRERIKKLLKILDTLNSKWEQIEPLLDQDVSKDQIADRELAYLVNFYKKLEATLHSFQTDINDLPPQDVLAKMLDVLPSFNRIDILIKQGKSPQEAYDLVAKRGNESLHEIKRQIREFERDFSKGLIKAPKEYAGDQARFHKEAIEWINICLGWGSQDGWEIIISSYTDVSEATRSKKFFEFISKLQHI